MTPDAPSRPAVIDATPTYARTAFSVGLLAVLYLWVFPYHPNINNPNENVRVYMTVAIVDDHTFAINRIERDWGYTNDKAARNGKLYSSKAPGTSYLGVPAYWLLTHFTHRDSHPLTPAQIHAHHAPVLDREIIVYFLRLWSNVLPALVFAWFWHRFLGKQTRSPALRDAAFFSSMAGSMLFAYSEMFASHTENAISAMSAIMAIATVRDRDRTARAVRASPPWSLGLMAATGFFAAAATMFEYPAALATFALALLVIATASEKRAELGFGALAFTLAGLVMVGKHHKAAAIVCAVFAIASYAFTLSPRSAVRLVCAGIGSIPPTFLTLFYHSRCFGDPFKPGYSYLENPTFHAETSQGFFGAISYSWEAGTRLWLDPAFGLVPMTALLLASILGFGAYLSWRPPRDAVPVVRGIVGIAVLVCIYQCLAMLADLAAGSWTGAIALHAHWLAYLVVACVLLASVTLPRPPRADAAIGATMLLSCFGLTRLIGMMNNWRGGWEVGPRYLATLVPMLSLAALVGLESIAGKSRTHRRAVTVFAAAATLHAMLMSGLPSAYFPHVPTEYVSPFFELFMPLVRDGYVPRNAGRFLFHWDGLRSMLPFFIAAAIIAWILLRGDERRPLAIGAHAMGALAVTCVLLAPFGLAAKYENMGVTRFVKDVWEPRPADDPRHPTAPPNATAASAASSPDALRARARRLAENGDTAGAFDAYRRAAIGR